MQKNKCNNAAPGEFLWKIRVRSVSHLDYWIKDYFGGLTISHEKDGSSILTGEFPDMSAVYGLILKLRDAGICLISLQVKRINQERWINNEEQKYDYPDY